jgi:hypothetical protein
LSSNLAKCVNDNFMEVLVVFVLADTDTHYNLLKFWYLVDII